MRQIKLMVHMFVISLFFTAPSFAEDPPKHGPRFDYYNVRNKPMRHGLAFRPEGEHKNDDLKLKAASAANGKKVYEALCIHCHGAEGKGTGKAASDLVMRPADLTKLTQQFPSYHFFMQISDGKGRDMPSWQDALSGKEIWDLVAYINTLKKK